MDDCHRQKKPDTKRTSCVTPQVDIQVCAQSVETFALDVNAHQKVSITEEMLHNQLVKITQTLAPCGNECNRHTNAEMEVKPGPNQDP